MTAQISNFGTTIRRIMKLRDDSPVLPPYIVLDKISELSNIINNYGKHTDEHKQALATLGHYKRKYRKYPEVGERITQLLRLKSLPGTWKTMSLTKRRAPSRRGGGSGAKRNTRRQ